MSLTSFPRRLLLCAAAVTTTGLAAAAFAQSEVFPARALTLVVPFPPGSISDTLGRAVAERASRALGQTIVVDNKPGANGALGAAQALRAKPDGYTFLMASNGIVSLNKLLGASMSYDPAELAPLALAAEVPAVLVARKGLAAQDLAGVIDLARHSEAGLSCASGQATAQIGCEMLKDLAGVRLTTVPYKGEPPGLTDLVGGQVDLMVVNLPVAAAQITSGNIKAIALVGARKLAAMPALELAGSTLPGYALPNGWTGFFASTAVPAPIRERLSRELLDALNAPELRQRVEATPGTVLTPENPAQLAARIASENALWKRLIESLKTPIQQ